MDKVLYRPNFGFTPPLGYHWLLERRLITFEPDGPLLPWYFLDNKTSFDTRTKWPKGPSLRNLVAFARRQDCDDIACFQVGADGAISIVLIEGWTGSGGYEIVERYATFWDWLKSVVADIASIAEEERRRTQTGL